MRNVSNYNLRDERVGRSVSRGVARILQGGPRMIFFRFETLHVAKRHAAHGKAMRFVMGVRGHAPQRNFC